MKDKVQFVRELVVFRRERGVLTTGTWFALTVTIMVLLMVIVPEDTAIISLWNAGTLVVMFILSWEFGLILQSFNRQQRSKLEPFSREQD